MKIHPFFVTGIFVVTSAAAYSVKKGDSLSAISKSHYGSWNKWPALWNNNKTLIKNPDLIYPGQSLSIPDAAEILASTKEELALLASNQGNPNYSGKSSEKSSKRSEEWRMLPEQSWEKFIFKTSPEIDPNGFDRRSKVAARVAEKTIPIFTVASDRIPIDGEIVNARTEYEQIFLGEQVFIRGEEQLQVGKVYSITKGPEKLVSDRTDRVGFIYELTGKVKIIGVRDGMFIGTIIASQKPINRGNLLIPEINSLNFTAPLASSTVIQANIYTAEFQNTSLISEQHLVILDAGTADGVKPGMIFRRYLKADPNTLEVITTKNYIIETDLQVLDAKDHFSTAVVLQTRSPINPGEEVLSLVDLSDFEKNSGMQIYNQGDITTGTKNELDSYEDTEGLGEKEDAELRQLEKINIEDSQDAGVIGNEKGPNDQLDANQVENTTPIPAPDELDQDTSEVDNPDTVDTTDKVMEPETKPDEMNELDSLEPPAETPKEEVPAADVTPTPTMETKPDDSIPEELNIPEDLGEASASASPSPSPSPSPTPAK